MKNKKTVTTLVILIALLAALASTTAIFCNKGPGSYEYESIRGKNVEIYGKGLYRHMSADVAIQGIAQDVVTLFAAIPLLITFLLFYRRGSLRAHFLLAGTIGYFFVTYLFYTAMGMYNMMFPVYITLLGCSFFALLLLLLSVDMKALSIRLAPGKATQITGIFLMLNSIAIALLWLEVIIPPLANGSIYPESLQHYTTLIVQGFDLGLLLPLAFVSGMLLYRRTDIGYLAGITYIIFLSFLMTALTAKIIAMGLQGYHIIPVIFIIPVFNLFAIGCAAAMIRSIRKEAAEKLSASENR
jgi:hypothetical protein